MASSNLAVQIRLELQTAQGETALKRFQSAVDAALAKLRSPKDVGIIKQLAAEVEAGKRKLDEIPAQWRKDVELITRASRGARLLDEVGIQQSHAQIQQSIQRLRQDFAALKSSGVLSQAELAQAAARTRQRMLELAEGLNGARSAMQGLGNAFATVQRAFAALAALSAGSQLFKVSDEMALLRARLSLVEGGTQRAGERLQQLFDVAKRGQADVAAIGESYAKFAATLRGIGRSGDDALRLTEALTLALRVSGAGAQQTSAVMLQLGQALQRGKLSGDEFASVAENGGKVLDYLAEALGVSRGELLRMAQAGELTTDKVLRLSDALDRIRKDAESLPQTVGGAAQNVSNAFKRWVSDAESVGAAGRAVIAVFNFVAENFNAVVNGALVVGLGLLISRVASFVNALRALWPVLQVIVASGFNPWAIAIGGAAVAVGVFWDDIKRLWSTLSDTEPLARAKRAVEDLSATLGQLQGAAQTAAQQLQQSIADETEKAKDTIKGLQDAYGQFVSATQELMQRRVAAIEDSYAQQQRAAQQAAQSEAQSIASGVQAVVDAEGQKLAAIAESQRQMEAGWQRAYGAAIELARASKQDVEAIEREGLEARIALYSQIEDAYRATVDRLIAEEQRHLDAVRRAEEERSNLRLSTEDRIRELARRGMDEQAAYQDRLLQVEEKQAAARAALQQGNFELAKKLAEEAMRLAERSASAAGKGIEQQEAAAKAIAEIKESAAIADQALQALGAAHQQAAQQAAAGAQEASAALQRVADEVTRLKAQLQEGATLQVQVKADDAQAAIERIRALLQAQEIVMSLKANADEALAALEQLKKDVTNTELTALVRAKTDAALQDIEQLQQVVEGADIQLGVSFEQARKGLLDFRQQTEDLLAKPTSSQHTVKPDASQVYAVLEDIKKPTSSTHTIYVRRVEARASGGLIGEGTRGPAAPGRAIAAFASGGPVGGFPLMRAGRVPGVGNGDTVPRTLQAGSFVLRKAAVQHYGARLGDVLRRLVPGFASGGMVDPQDYATNNPTVRRLLDAIREAERIAAMYEAEAEELQIQFQKEVRAMKGRRFQSLAEYNVAITRQDALRDRADDAQLQAKEQRTLIKRWLAELEKYRIRRYASGGAASDTVPAMLTPGEYVVRRDVVARLGTGFFDALNQMRLPRRALDALLQRAWLPVRGFASGGLVQEADRVAFSTRPAPSAPVAASEPAIAARAPTASLTVHVHGVSDPERLARQIEPHLQQLIRLKAA